MVQRVKYFLTLHHMFTIGMDVIYTKAEIRHKTAKPIYKYIKKICDIKFLTSNIAKSLIFKFKYFLLFYTI